MSNVKLFRLLNGEEIIAEVVIPKSNNFPAPDIIKSTLVSNADSVTIKNPVKVMIVPSKADPKTPTIGFAPWCEFTEDKEFVLKKDHILLTMNPIDEFLKQYNQIFGKLVVPTNKLVIPTN